MPHAINPLHEDSFMICVNGIESLTRTLNSLPGLKCNRALAGNCISSPVLGFRPERTA